MKAAFWGIALIVMGAVGIVLINLFGNITVTNQLNYTTMKNAVESSMHDSLNLAYYRSGFCLCTDINKSDDNKWHFKNDTEYDLVDITHTIDANKKDVEECKSSKKYCEILHGEYRINKRVFAESLTRRFAEMVNNDKDYQVIIQDIIEYPPKVSVRINSEDDEFLPTDKGDGYTIVNQMDAIIETEKIILTPEVTATPTPKPTPTPTPRSTATPKATTPPTTTATPVPTATPIPNPAAIYKVTVHHYLEGTKTKVHDDDVINLAKGDKYKTSSYDSNKLSGKYKDKYVWNKKKPDNASGKMKTKNITVKYYYKIKPGKINNNCNMHYFNLGLNVTCTKKTNSGKQDCEGVGTSKTGNPAKSTSCPCSGCSLKSNYSWGNIYSCTGCTQKSSKKYEISLSSSENSYSSKSKAKSDCEKEANKACKNKGYDSASETGCAAVKSWKCNKDTSTVYAYHQTDAPSKYIEKGYDCDCLG